MKIFVAWSKTRATARGEQPAFAWAQVPSHASTASAQRLQRSSWAGFLPTSSRIIQQRAHLLPRACSNLTATPSTSGSRKASSGAATLATWGARGDRDLGEIEAFEDFAVGIVGEIDERRRFEAGADHLVAARDLERAGDDAADRADAVPLLDQGRRPPCLRRVEEGMQMHAVVREALRPRLFHREAEHRREPGHDAAEDLVEHGARGAAARRLQGRRSKARPCGCRNRTPRARWCRK